MSADTLRRFPGGNEAAQVFRLRLSDAQCRARHVAYNDGVRTIEVVAGELEYQRRRKRRQRAGEGRS